VGACINCSGINAVAIVTVTVKATASGTQYSENSEKILIFLTLKVL